MLTVSLLVLLLFYYAVTKSGIVSVTAECIYCFDFFEFCFKLRLNRLANNARRIYFACVLLLPYSVCVCVFVCVCVYVCLCVSVSVNSQLSISSFTSFSPLIFFHRFLFSFIVTAGSNDRLGRRQDRE